MLKEHCKKYRKIRDAFKIQIIQSENAKRLIFNFSVGDAIREVNSSNKVESDFVFLTCDEFANFDLHDAIQFHFK